MTIRVSIDTREVRALTVDLTRAPGRLQRGAPKVMRSIAVSLERAMKRDALGHRYLPKFSPEITKERRDALGLAWSIGFEREGQGELAHIIVFGSVNNAPVYNFHGPLHRQRPKIAHKLGVEAENAVLGGIPR